MNRARLVVVLATLAVCVTVIGLSHPHLRAFASGFPHVRLHAAHLAHAAGARHHQRLRGLRHVTRAHRLFRRHRWLRLRRPFWRTRRTLRWLGL
jgi:hypothetical protein